MSSTTAHAVFVHRWRSVHLVAGDHPAAERVKQRLDDSLSAGFDRAAEDALAAGFGSETELVFLRLLHIDVAVDASWDRRQLAAAWSSAFARGLLRELAAGASENVVRFSTREHWVASYIAEPMRTPAMGFRNGISDR